MGTDGVEGWERMYTGYVRNELFDHWKGKEGERVEDQESCKPVLVGKKLQPNHFALNTFFSYLKKNNNNKICKAIEVEKILFVHYCPTPYLHTHTHTNNTK